jgi:hypothetical protein
LKAYINGQDSIYHRMGGGERAYERREHRKGEGVTGYGRTVKRGQK